MYSRESELRVVTFITNALQVPKILTPQLCGADAATGPMAFFPLIISNFIYLCQYVTIIAIFLAWPSSQKN